MIKYFLMLNKQGHTRLSQYYEYIPIDKRSVMEAEIVRKCITRNDNQCCFFDYEDYKIVYRRYASLFFVFAVDPEENELSILEFIHSIVETLDVYFSDICELDIMFNLEKAHFIIEEMIANGNILETNKTAILNPISMLDDLEN